MLSPVMFICSKSSVYVALSLVSTFLNFTGLFVVLRVELLIFIVVGICGGDNGTVSACFDDFNVK